MLKFWKLIVVLLLTASLFPASAFAQEKTSTGFVYPLGRGSWNQGGGWMERDAAHGGGYFDGKYHIGEDMMANIGSSVYAIATGTVTSRSYSGWGDGNLALVIKHKLSDGSEFLALYGHIRSSKPVGATVTAGEVVGTIGPYPYGNHLHFGIRPGTAMPATNWGIMPDSSWNSANGFVNPVTWIRGRTPSGSGGTTGGTTGGSAGGPVCESDLNAFLAGSPMAGLGGTFIKWGKYFDVDPRLIIAIASAESSLGRNLCGQSNAWGWMWPPTKCANFVAGIDPDSKSYTNAPGYVAGQGVNFTSGWDNGIFWLGKTFAKDYFPQGQTTVDSISTKYCTSGCTNWLPNVKSAMATMKGDPNKLRFPGVASSCGGSTGGGGNSTVTNQVDDSDLAAGQGKPGFYKHPATKNYWTTQPGLGFKGQMTWAYTNGTSVYNRADWVPNLAAAGRYELHAHVPRNYATTRNAVYEVSHAGGVSKVAVDQSVLNDNWKSLGTYQFNAGSSAKVSLTDATRADEDYTNNKRMVGFDAIKWTLVGPPPTPEPVWEGSLDSPAANEVIAGNYNLRGWAWDKSGKHPVKFLEIYVDGERIFNADYGQFRSDLGRNIAWSRVWDSSRWAGKTVTVMARASTGTKWFDREKRVSVRHSVGQGSARQAKFVEAFNRNGAQAKMGYAQNAVHAWGNVTIQDFNEGQFGLCAIIDDANVGLGAWLVRNGMWEKYKLAGGPAGALGAPRSDERVATVSPRGTRGAVQDFANGHIVSTPMGMFATSGEIDRKYIQMGASGGILGFATRDADSGPSSKSTAGSWSHFEGGLIISSPRGTFAVHSEMVPLYAAQNGRLGPLGFPISDAFADRGGLRQNFEGGFLSTVAQTNRSPILANATFVAPQNVAFSRQLVGTDADKDILFYKVIAGTLPTGLILKGNGLLVGKPTQIGVQTFTVRVADGKGGLGTAKIAINVSIPNRAPVLANAAFAATKSVAFSKQLAGTDADRDALTYQVSAGTLPLGLRLTASGLLAGTPTQIGAQAFTVRAADGKGGVANARIAVNVIDNSPTTKNVSGNAIAGRNITLNLSSTDPLGGGLRYQIIQAPRGVGITGGAYFMRSGSQWNLIYRSSETFVGTEIFRFVAIAHNGSQSAPAMAFIRVQKDSGMRSSAANESARRGTSAGSASAGGS